MWRLAPDSEPPEQEEEAQSEGEEEAVLGIEIGWILPALRRLRGGRRGESVSHWPVSLLPGCGAFVVGPSRLWGIAVPSSMSRGQLSTSSR